MNKYDIINTATLNREALKSADGRRLEIHEIAYEGFDFIPGQFVMVQVVSRSFEWAYPYMVLCKSDSGFKVTATPRSSLYGLNPGTPLTVWGANGRGLSIDSPVTLVAEASTLFLTAPFFHTGPDHSLIYIGKEDSFINNLGTIHKTIVSSCSEASHMLTDTEGTIIIALNYSNIREVMDTASDSLKARTEIFASTTIACGVGACKGCYLHSPDIQSGFAVCCEGPYLPYNRIDFDTDEKCFHYFQ